MADFLKAVRWVAPRVLARRVRLYGKPLLLPEEIMEEPLLKVAWFALETAKLGNLGNTMGQAQVPSQLADPILLDEEEEEARRQ